jgi:hypothetical protein
MLVPASERSNQNIAEPGRPGEAQRSPSAFVAEMEIESHVQTGAGAQGSGKRR